MRNYPAAIAALNQASSVCVITHLRPDADAVGSAAALMLGLRSLGKEVRAVIGQEREISANLLSIPSASEIELVSQLPAGFDLYVTVDCGSIDRTGLVAAEVAELAQGTNLVCIDHHASNDGFGAVNVVDTDCESTTMVLMDLLDELGVTYDQPLAHCLYAGLMTDTGSFRWGRPDMHVAAARLMEFDLDTKAIAEQLLDTTTSTDLHMVGEVLAGVRIIPAGSLRLGVLVGHLDVIGGHADSAVESLVDFVRALAGTDMGVVFKEQSPGRWAVSLRSSRVNCAEVALGLGGGGHVPAAGYTAVGTEEEIIAELVEAIGRN